MSKDMTVGLARLGVSWGRYGGVGSDVK